MLFPFIPLLDSQFAAMLFLMEEERNTPNLNIIALNLVAEFITTSIFYFRLPLRFVGVFVHLLSCSSAFIETHFFQ